MSTKAKDAQQRHVAVAFGKKRHTGEQQDSAPGDQAKLVHDKTRELRGAGLAHVLARLGQAVDLGGSRAHHHGRQVAKEDATRLDRDQVADADGRIGIEPDGDRIGHNAKEQVHEHAKTRDNEP